MARFVVDSSMDDIIRQMQEMGQLTGPLADAMLMAGAAEDRIAWQTSAEQHGHRDTGQMIASIGYPRRPKDVGGIREIDIYPQGVNNNGVRNAEVAFVLHYGTSRRPGSWWVDDADALAGPMISTAMTSIFDTFMATGQVPKVDVPNWTAERNGAKAVALERRRPRRRRKK